MPHTLISWSTISFAAGKSLVAAPFDAERRNLQQTKIMLEVKNQIVLRCFSGDDNCCQMPGANHK